MTLEQLQNLGFEIVGGMVDRKGKNYGRLRNPLQADLTPEGEELVKTLISDQFVPVNDPLDVPETIRPAGLKPGRPRKQQSIAPTVAGLDLLDV